MTKVTFFARRDFLKIGSAATATLAFDSLLASARAARGPGEFLNVSDFGARGDGSTDNTDALLRLRSYLQSDRSKHYLIYLAPGTYRYSDNSWLAQVRSFTLNGYGARLQNTRSDLYLGDKQPLSASGPFWGFGNSTPGRTNSAGRHYGYRIHTVAAGVDNVSLLAGSEVANFSVGNRVLIHGFDQQWNGFPPNMRFFEWNLITAIDATGNLRLLSPLHNDYRADWYDLTEGKYGAARIINLERQNGYVGEYASFEGIELLKNPSSSADSDNVFQFPVEHLLMKDVRLNGMWPYGHKLLSASDCQFLGLIEGDKICDSVKFSRCRMEPDVDAGAVTMAAFTGINNVVIEDSTVRLGMEVASRNFVCRRNTIIHRNGQRYGAVGYYGFGWPVQSIVFEDNTIVHSGSLNYALAGPSAGTPVKVAGGGLKGELLIADDTVGRSFVRRAYAGGVGVNADLSKRGRITSVGWNGTYHVVAGTWNAAPTAGEVWRTWNVQSVKRGNTKFVGGDRQILGSRYAWFELEPGKKSIRMQLDEPLGFPSATPIYQSVFAFGYLRRVVVNIVRPSTAPGIRTTINPRMALTSFSPVYGNLFTLPLVSAGQFELRTDGYANSLGVVPKLLSATQIYEELKFSFYDCVGSDAEYPQLTVELDIDCAID